MSHEFAINYLARHALDSGNHPDIKTFDEAMEAALACEGFEYVETYDDRATYRKSLQNQGKKGDINVEGSPAPEAASKSRARPPKDATSTDWSEAEVVTFPFAQPFGQREEHDPALAAVPTTLVPPPL